MWKVLIKNLISVLTYLKKLRFSFIRWEGYLEEEMSFHK